MFQLSIFKKISINFILCGGLFITQSAHAEYKQYGNVHVDGLTLNGASHNAERHHAMVCNVNGVDGYLSIRSGAGTKYKIRRKLNRLARLTVSPKHQKNGWVPIITADRLYSADGYPLKRPKSLHVKGWAHGNFICDYSVNVKHETPVAKQPEKEVSQTNIVVIKEQNTNSVELKQTLSELKYLNLLLEHLKNTKELNELKQAKQKAINEKIAELKRKNSIVLKNNKSVDLSALRSKANLDMITTSEYFPKIAYSRPGTNDKGVMWLKPTITDVGDLEYKLSFIAPNSKFDDTRDSLTLDGKKLQIISKGLVQAYDWGVVAKEKNIRKIYEKVSGCISDDSCKVKEKGKSSIEVLFKIYEDGVVGTGLRINRGKYSKGYNYSMNNALLLSAYIEFMKDVSNKELEAGSMTNKDLDNLFE